jgi:cytochrome c biogenesis protein ResB
LERGRSGENAAVGLIRWWRDRRREKEAERRSLARMRRVSEADVPVEPKEAKLSQLRD